LDAFRDLAETLMNLRMTMEEALNALELSKGTTEPEIGKIEA
jgi:hypothetical protein